MRIGKSTSCVLGTASALLVMAACSTNSPSAPSGSGTQQGEPLAITYSPPVAGALPFLPVEVALKKGYFTQQGVTVTVKPTSPAALPAALSANQINMSADVVYNSARYVESGVGVKYVAGLNDNVDFQLLAAKGVNIPKPAEGTGGWKASFAAMKGMKVGVNAKAGPLGLTLIALFKMAGVEPGGYTLVDTPGTVALNALSAKQVDAVVSGGGFGTAIVEAGVANQILDFSTGINDVFGKQVNAALIVTEATLKQSPSLAGKVQAAIKAADTFISDPANSAEVVTIATSSGTAKTTMLPQAIAGYKFSSDLNLSGIQAALDWAQQAGITKKQIDAKSLIADGTTTS